MWAVKLFDHQRRAAPDVVGGVVMGIVRLEVDRTIFNPCGLEDFSVRSVACELSLGTR
jgi:hypothetical protein